MPAFGQPPLRKADEAFELHAPRCSNMPCFVSDTVPYWTLWNVEIRQPYATNKHLSIMPRSELCFRSFFIASRADKVIKKDKFWFKKYFGHRKVMR